METISCLSVLDPLIFLRMWVFSLSSVSRRRMPRSAEKHRRNRSDSVKTFRKIIQNMSIGSIFPSALERDRMEASENARQTRILKRLPINRKWRANGWEWKDEIILIIIFSWVALQSKVPTPVLLGAAHTRAHVSHHSHSHGEEYLLLVWKCFRTMFCCVYAQREIECKENEKITKHSGNLRWQSCCSELKTNRENTKWKRKSFFRSSPRLRPLCVRLAQMQCDYFDSICTRAAAAREWKPVEGRQPRARSGLSFHFTFNHTILWHLQNTKCTTCNEIHKMIVHRFNFCSHFSLPSLSPSLCAFY